MRDIIVFCMVVVVHRCLFAEHNYNILWSRTYGGEQEEVANDVAIASNGDYLVAGMTRTYRQNMYLVRTNIVGDTIWTTNPGLYWQPETAFGVAESVDGSIFVAGQGIAGHGGDMYWSAQVHKYQSNGTFMWYHDYGELYADDIAYDIIEATVNNQHGFVIAGTTNSVDIAGWDAPDAFLIRFNANGGVVWTRAYHRGGSLDDSGFGSVVRTIDGGFFCAGYASDWLSPNLEQGFIVKTDSLGNALWSRTWGGGCCHYYSAGRQSSDTSFWCVGAFLDDGNYNSMLHHWSNTGDYIGATVLGGLFDDNLFDLIQTPDGSFIVTGYTQLEDQTADLYLAKIDAAGSVVWEHTYGGEQIEVGTAIERLSDGTYLLAGYTTSFGAGDKDMWLLRVNPDNVLPAGEPSYPLPRSTQLRVFPNPFNSVTTLFVELSEPEPIRLQVYDINGRLVRQIVEQTALPPNYVARFDGTELPSGSYYLYLTHPRRQLLRDAFFCDDNSRALSANRKHHFNKTVSSPATRLTRLPEYLFAALEQEIARKTAAGRDVINLGIGDPDLPPPDSFTKSLQLHAADPDAHFYSSSRGDAGVRKVIAKYFKEDSLSNSILTRRSVLCWEGKKVCHLLGRAFVNPGDVVACPSPAYPVYAQGVTTLCDAEVCTLPLYKENGFLPDLNLAVGARMLFVNYPNNPTGAIATEFFWNQLADFADTHPETIVSHDHAYSEMTFDDYVAPSFLQYTQNAVEMHSLSKVFNATGFRIGYCVGRADYISALVKAKSQIDSGAPLMIQRAMADGLAGYKGQEPPKEVIAIRKIYGERRVYTEHALKDLGLDVVESPATFYVWARVGDDEMSFVQKCLDHDVVVTPGRGFGAEGRGYIRLALTQSLDRIKLAMSRIA